MAYTHNPKQTPHRLCDRTDKHGAHNYTMRIVTTKNKLVNKRYRCSGRK